MIYRCLIAVLLFAVPCVAEDAASGWPREISHDTGTIVVYQPQNESLEGDQLRSRAAVSVTLEGGEPVFGVVWTDARVAVDREQRTVQVLDVDVTEVRFPEVTDEQKARFAAFVEPQIESWNMVVSLDRVLANLAAVEQERDLNEGLKSDPPTILYSSEPAVLIQIDGEPRYRSIEDDKFKRVINTPYTIVQDNKTSKYYLDGGIEWYGADVVMGPWEVTKAPKKIRKLRSEKAQQAAEEQLEAVEEYIAPKVIVAIEPTELIVTDGKPDYAPIEGTTALYVTNADGDVLIDVDSQVHYVVLSGRWYRSKTLDGPWEYVASDALPATFAQIPENSDLGHLLVFVAGTDPAREAVMDSNIPQTAAVRRGSALLQIAYDGPPKFEPIEGTGMEYAINTGSSVLRIDGVYWACESAVWYTGPGPEGPWEVAAVRPDEIDKIPPSNPHYNTKYVYVYDSTPDVVYVGYTSGYMSSYAYGGSVVYGTGWYYPAWYGAHYYPYHATWGYSVHYNPWYGWGVGLTWSNGPFSITIGYGGWGGYGYPYNYWGPGGIGYVPVPVYPGRPAYRPPAGWNPGAGNAANRPGVNPTASRPGAASSSNNMYKRPENSGRVANQAGGQGLGSRQGAGPNNVYAGRDGNVYQRGADGSWGQRQGGDWKGVAGNAAGGLERDARSRSRGAQRSGGFQGSRGGGGRRR